MKKVIGWLLIAALVVSCIFLAACGGGGGETATTDGGGTTTTGGGATTAGGGAESADEDNGGDSLADILGRGAEITAVEYDSVITTPDGTTTTIHIWLEEDKMRSESDMGGGVGTVVSIVDMAEQVMYQYFPDQNMAYKMSYTQGESTAITETQSIPDYDYTVIGTEIVDGKECLVVEYTTEQATVKMWIWEEHGFPLRIETTTAEGKIVVECQNIEFGDIDDDMFELPDGVQVIEM